MRKYTIIILIAILLLTPFVSLQANEGLPIFEDDSLYNNNGGGNTGNNTGGPSGYTFCVNENQNLNIINRCDFSGTKDVAYGANGKFVYMRSITNGINCSYRIFGDPIYGVAKACYTKDNSGSGSSTPGLVVDTIKADGITQNTATLHGVGGYKTSSINPPLITAYFRYAKATNNPPIFCNDIYGSNMTATGDIFLRNITPSLLTQSFSQQITGLSPNTTYYYCAIISNKNNIAYGGESIVKQFHTNCYTTTVETKSPATNIRSTSASLAGSYCSPKNSLDKAVTNDTVTTYFEYKKATMPGGTPSVFATVPGSEKPYSMGNNANLYGNINVNLSGLTPDTTYQFKAVVKNNAGKSNEAVHYGSTFNFTTIPGSGGGGISQCTGVNCPTTPKTCTLPYILNTSTNTCFNPNPLTDCSPGGACPNHPNNPCPPGASCDTGSGSGTWTGGTWTNGNWTGGTWNGGSWNNGVWTSGTWTGGTWTNGNWTGGTWTNVTQTGGTGTNNTNPINLTLGQTATPPNDAIVRYHEGIETVFARQIIANPIFKEKYGYQAGADLQNFAWYWADEFAKMFGYINEDRKEIRVSFPDVAAYELQLVGNKLTVYEYFYNKIVDIRNINTAFKNASDYEYYFKK